VLRLSGAVYTPPSYRNHKALTPATARAGEAASDFCGVLPWGGYGGAKPFHDREVQGGRPPASYTAFNTAQTALPLPSMGDQPQT
jgi:hypothetical protein